MTDANITQKIELATKKINKLTAVQLVKQAEAEFQPIDRDFRSVFGTTEEDRIFSSKEVAENLYLPLQEIEKKLASASKLDRSCAFGRWYGNFEKLCESFQKKIKELSVSEFQANIKQLMDELKIFSLKREDDLENIIALSNRWLKSYQELSSLSRRDSQGFVDEEKKIQIILKQANASFALLKKSGFSNFMVQVIESLIKEKDPAGSFSEERKRTLRGECALLISDQRLRDRLMSLTEEGMRDFKLEMESELAPEVINDTFFLFRCCGSEYKLRSFLPITGDELLQRLESIIDQNPPMQDIGDIIWGPPL